MGPLLIKLKISLLKLNEGFTVLLSKIVDINPSLISNFRFAIVISCIVETCFSLYKQSLTEPLTIFYYNSYKM